MGLKSSKVCPKPACAHEVYLGGSGDPTTWRQDIAIPMLERAGVRYFYPAEGVVEGGMNCRKEEAHVLLYVIDNETRAIASLVEAAYYMGKGKRVVVAMYMMNAEMLDWHNMNGIRPLEVKDLNKGRAMLTQFARESEVPVFDTVEEAVRKIIGDLGYSEIQITPQTSI